MAGKFRAEEKVALGATKPTDPLNIPLGTEVWDAVTGFQGCLVQRCEASEGNIRYAVQPMGDGSAIPDALMMDYHTILVVGPGVSIAATPVPNPTSIRVKDRVKDKVSGFEGIVNGKLTWMNGCEYLEVVGKATDKYPTGPVALSQAHFWEKVDDGLNVKPKSALIASTEVKIDAKKPPGGPMTRMAKPIAFRG